MVIPVYEIIFYFFAIALIASAFMVVLSKNPVQSILFLVLCFFCSSVLWLMIQAEFLALVLIFVYVGAVMTLFLFVVMMINFKGIFYREQFVRYAPFALLLFVLFVAEESLALISTHLPVLSTTLKSFPKTYANTKQLGQLLFTHYIYPFEVAGAILLVAIIAAIMLAFQGRRQDAKQQKMAEQHAVTKEQRLRIVKMKGEGA